MSADIGSVALQFVQSYVLPALGVGLTGLLAVWMGQWQARAKVAAMQKNADLAVKAAEQIKKTTGMSNEDARKYALGLATTWNKLAGINVTDVATVLPMNEGAMQNLPSATVIQPNSTNTTVTTTTSTSASVPNGTTTDEKITPQALG